MSVLHICKGFNLFSNCLVRVQVRFMLDDIVDGAVANPASQTGVSADHRAYITYAVCPFALLWYVLLVSASVVVTPTWLSFDRFIKLYQRHLKIIKGMFCLGLPHWAFWNMHIWCHDAY